MIGIAPLPLRIINLTAVVAAKKTFLYGYKYLYFELDLLTEDIYKIKKAKFSYLFFSQITI